MKQRRIAVLGANAPSIPFYRQAKDLGYYIIGIAWAEGAVCKKYCDKFYPISFKDKDEVLRVCREEKIDGITSFSLESALPTVVYVAQSMGLVSNTEECLRLTETKYAQRCAFEQNGIPVPRYYRVENAHDLQVLDLDYPIIVKPLDSGGSQGIMKLNDSSGLAEAFKNAIEHSRSNRAIIEEYVDGREFSVEYLSCKGKHYFVQITDKITSGEPHFIEMAHHQPADISDTVASSIKALVEKALTALKIENSPSHTEVKQNSKGDLYIIEIGARMGGDYITSDLVRLSTGYDMVQGAIELATGNFLPPVVLDPQRFSGVYFYSSLAPDVAGIIRKRADYPAIVEAEIIEGPLPPAKSNADRNGFIIYQSNKEKMVL